ncbi:TIGR04222 domain-containing membrane protein [Modestobacter muralis]|uniref:TIGR04222 domain-containing membrane protein n=1 Tax=Modestobacter muralis TaxID=1608614 RepID=A0A6P0H332_9ACTN|nr:TIGR04222 domain-containing membrane protein [Modestobacter muralis]NEK93082.1 TIGR04222 domain-containing membrane protein [Modestobacter muralis]NEN49849.1 TIGR04222 domain-containing membrane protein [Modestobacter muralis]
MTGTRTRTDTYDLAQLAGGPARVADTAVVALLARGRLRADGGGMLHAVGAAPVHPVEAAVFDLVGPRPQRSALTLRARVQDDPRVVAVADRLQAEGLLRPARWSRLSGPRPALVPTRDGRRVLVEARQQGTAGQQGGVGQELAVALDGVGAMADQELRRLVFGAAGDPARSGGGRPRRTGAPWSTGSPGSILAWGGDGGAASWGGGGWGGDGGGCGGGDGGGGGGC